jgi:hypothetical protein
MDPRNGCGAIATTLMYCQEVGTMLEIARNESKAPVGSRLPLAPIVRNPSAVLAEGPAEARRTRPEVAAADRLGLRAGLERLEALARSGPGAAGRAQALGEVMVARAELAEARLQTDEVPASPVMAPPSGLPGLGTVEAPRPGVALPSASKAGAIAVARGRVETARAHLVAARTYT